MLLYHSFHKRDRRNANFFDVLIVTIGGSYFRAEIANMRRRRSICRLWHHHITPVTEACALADMDGLPEDQVGPEPSGMPVNSAWPTRPERGCFASRRPLYRSQD